MKRIFSTIVFASLALSTFAGGLLTNTNQSASFVRNPMRYASLETDAIYFNPAGTAFFKEGWALSANWQMVWQDRDVENLLSPDKKKFEGKVYVPCMPTILASYKTGDWTFSGFFGMPGGGGKAEFNEGLPLFNNLIGQLGGSLGAMAPIPMNVYGVSQFESTQYMFSLQLGAAYKISDNWSVYGGIRGNYVNNNYMGTIKAIADLSAANMGTQDVMAVDIDMDQSGISFTPVIGVDYKVGDFNLAAKYEFRAINHLENDTKKLDIAASEFMNGIGMGQIIEGAAGGALGSYLGGFADGKSLRSDAPAMLSLAGSWQATSWFKAMIGGVYYFDKDAKVESLLGGDNNKNLDHNTYELLAGVEFNVTEKLLLSAGVQFSDFGITDQYISDISFTNDSFMTGLGAKYSFTENLDLNVGFCYASYASYKTQASNYIRNTYNATIGVDFRF